MSDAAPQRSALFLAAATATLTLAGAVTAAGLFGWIGRPEPTGSPPPTVFVPIMPSAAPPAEVASEPESSEQAFEARKHHERREHHHEHEEHDDDE